MIDPVSAAARSRAHVRRAVCCACHQQCGVQVHVAGGRPVRITGDKEHPVSAGFICTKGAHALELHAHPDRLHRPLKRVGARGSGRWQPIPWDHALDEIAAAILDLSASHGPESLAYAFGTFRGADWGIGQRFMNRFGSPNSAGQDKVCYGPAALGEALTYGYGPSFLTFPIPGRTRCMIVWGFRPSASMPLMWRQILHVQRAGAKLIVVDPIRTREARTADLWLQNIPGSDVALALGLVHCILAEERYDAAFVEARTVGFEALRTRVLEYPPKRVEALTGVPAARIRDAARLYAGHRPALVHGGNGLCQSGISAVQTGRALACLVAITGNLGVEGGHVLAGPPRDLAAYGEVMAEAALPRAQDARRLGGARFPVLGAGFAGLDDAMSRAWHGRRGTLGWLRTAHEPMLWRAIVERDPYAVTGLILQHHNPVGASANAGAAAAALVHPNLELLVAQDLFLNASSSLADYVLPAAHWLEKPFFSMGLGTLGVFGDYAEAKSAPIDPEHEHRSDYDFWRDLARRCGQAEHWPETAAALWDDCLRPAGLDFESLCARLGPVMGEGARSPLPPTAGAGYGTPSGKIELYSGLLADWDRDPLPGFERSVWPAPDGAGYPLVLTSGGRMIEGFHQDAQHLTGFRRKHVDPEVSLHPDAAARAGVRAGEWVWIESPIGRVRQRARIDPDLRPDVVHADRWWYPERGGDPADPFGWRTTNVNVCTDDDVRRCDPVLGTWLLRGVPCRLRAADQP